jgi:hypothetical protein
VKNLRKVQVFALEVQIIFDLNNGFYDNKISGLIVKKQDKINFCRLWLQVNQPAYGRVNFARLPEAGIASRQRAERGWCRRRHAERADCAHVKRRVALFLTPRGKGKGEA